MGAFFEFFKEHQWTIVAVIAVLGLISGIINTFLGKKNKGNPEKETFRVVSEQLTRAKAGAAGKYFKAADTDIYQKVHVTEEEDHVS